MQRRTIFSAGLGGLALVSIAGVWRVMRTPVSAYDPWKLVDLPEADARLQAFRYAILAPNPHNRQPWTIRLVGENEAIVSCDLERRLPITDPFDRQITIGFGAFLEIARIAAAQSGHRIDIELFPEGEAVPRLDERPIAHLAFSKQENIKFDPLFSAITARRTNKEVYDIKRIVEASLLKKIVQDGGSYSADPELVARLREQILEGIRTEISTPAAYQESVDLMRIGYGQVDANPDGIDLIGPMIEAGIVTGQINQTELGDMNSQAYKVGFDQASQTYASIPSLIWIKSDENTRSAQIESGRQYLRANLQATKFGLAMHPMSQTLQEYAEVAQPFSLVHALLGANGDERVQMLARVGYAPRVGPSPRWPLETHII